MKSNQDKSLTDRHERFVHEYLIDQNASAAAARAGYSARTKGTHAAQLMQNPAVRARIVEELADLYARLKLNALDVLRGQVRAAYLDPARLFDASHAPIPLDQLDEDTRGGLTVSYAQRRDGDYTLRVKQAPRHVALGILQKRLEAFEKLQAQTLAELHAQVEREAGEKAAREQAAAPRPIFQPGWRLDEATQAQAPVAPDSAPEPAAPVTGQGAVQESQAPPAPVATGASPDARLLATLTADDPPPPPSPNEPGYDFKKDPAAGHGGRYTAWNRYWAEKRARDLQKAEETAALANPPPNMRVRPGQRVPVRMEPGYNPPWLRDNRPEFAIGAGECYLD
jgi:phage terminase small subunit